MKEKEKRWPVRFGAKEAEWTSEEAAEFLKQHGGKFTTSEEFEQGPSHGVEVAGIELLLRVLDGRWRWAFNGDGFFKNGKKVLRKWHKAVREQTEAAFLNK